MRPICVQDSFFKMSSESPAGGCFKNAYELLNLRALKILFLHVKAADDDAGKPQPVFLKRLYLLHICIFSFFLFNASLTTI